MRYAESVEEAVQQLGIELASFLHTQTKDTWENLQKHCQQLSQWIEHGAGVTLETKPELVKTLFAAEKVLLEHRQYSSKKL